MSVVHHRAAKSATQRSREFRERNPGYYRQYYLNRKAERSAALADAAAQPVTVQEPERIVLALPAPMPADTLVLDFTAPQREKVRVAA